MKIVVNPTWRCQLSCAYCWVRGLGITPGPEEPPSAWLAFLRTLPKPLTVDLSGGEPTLYAGLFDLLYGLTRMGATWAITTNLVDDAAYHNLRVNRIPGCGALNVSAHAGGPADLYERARALADAGYPVRVNVVDHPAARPIPPGLDGSVIPYQAWIEGAALDGVTRRCDAGREHIVCGPDGAVYRCAVEMQVGAAPLGLIGQGWAAIAPVEPHVCRLGCSTCYTANPAAWQVRMEGLT